PARGQQGDAQRIVLPLPQTGFGIRCDRRQPGDRGPHTSHEETSLSLVDAGARHGGRGGSTGGITRVGAPRWGEAGHRGVDAAPPAWRPARTWRRRHPPPVPRLFLVPTPRAAGTAPLAPPSAGGVRARGMRGLIVGRPTR